MLDFIKIDNPPMLKFTQNSPHSTFNDEDKAGRGQSFLFE
jgi:hypothetical protein